MKLTSFAPVIVIAVLGGCTPAPKQVFIDFDKIPAQKTTVSENIISPVLNTKPQTLTGNVGGRDSRILEEKEGAQLWEEAKSILAANRERSLTRLRADLERKYIGESRARAIEAERANAAIDDREWNLVLENASQVMDRYAGRKTELSADLAGRIGFPDRGQPVPRRRREEVYAEMRAEKVEALRKELKELNLRFESELSALLVAYQRERQQRILAILELDYAGDQAALARAEQEALAAVRDVMGQVDAAIPQLQKQLGALKSVNVTSATPRQIDPQFKSEVWVEGMSRQEVMKYANVFAKAKGYQLTNDKNYHDSTDEFKKWLKKNVASR